jgi:DNA modification methylase
MQSRKPSKGGQVVQQSRLGKLYWGDSSQILSSRLGKTLHGKVQLILTSPPFPLNHKKSYGNLNGDRYEKWFSELAPRFADLLVPTGSIVIEMGNAWMPDRPIQSLLHLESLIAFVKNPQTNLRLCQQFICYNPSRLPSPAQWVTIKRIRATDSFTNLWWIAKTDFPKADNRKVLRPYSASMKALLKRGTYNSGKRPSEHHISKRGFLTRHKGSIMPNLFELEAMESDRAVRLPNSFSLSNTNSNDFFLRECRKQKVVPHPARMPVGLSTFFIQFLTAPGDLVFDPFAGSNTTGFAAERLGRRWVSIEIRKQYARQSKIRFRDPSLRSK